VNLNFAYSLSALNKLAFAIGPSGGAYADLCTYQQVTATATVYSVSISGIILACPVSTPIGLNIWPNTTIGAGVLTMSQFSISATTLV
jgi:hypothetical protein